MKNTLTIICLVLLAACSNTKNTGTTGSTMNTPGGTSAWTSLFDGKTTNGWHQYGKQGAVGWIVDDGALTINEAATGGHGDLVTDKEYGNFDLKLDWKISKNGNSGIIFFIHEDAAKYPATYETGLEMQVLDNDGHPDGKIIKHRAGDLYDLITVKKETVKPVGEWNQVEIKSKDGKLDLYLNGENVVSTPLWNDNWRNMVANSKFKTMAGFGTFKSGKIGLQYHGDKVWYRNIQVKEL